MPRPVCTRSVACGASTVGGKMYRCDEASCRVQPVIFFLVFVKFGTLTHTTLRLLFETLSGRGESNQISTILTPRVATGVVVVAACAPVAAIVMPPRATMVAHTIRAICETKRMTEPLFDDARCDAAT